MGPGPGIACELVVFIVKSVDVFGRVRERKV